MYIIVYMYNGYMYMHVHVLVRRALCVPFPSWVAGCRQWSGPPQTAREWQQSGRQATLHTHTTAALNECLIQKNHNSLACMHVGQCTHLAPQCGGVSLYRPHLQCTECCGTDCSRPCGAQLSVNITMNPH